MGASKIQSEQEIKDWYAEGKTIAWMVDEYKRKYNLEVRPGMFGNFRARHGLPRRIARDDALIPWAVKPEHRWAYPVLMLRVEARERAGFPVRPTDVPRLASFKKMLADQNLVVHYDPDTTEGFFYIPRSPEDTDIIREPKAKTTTRARID